MVATFQQHRHQIGLDGNGSVAHPVKHVFDDMGETDDGVQPKQPGRSLDGVRGTEYGAKGVGIVRVGLQPQQRVLHVLQQFAGFGDESLQGLVEVYVHFLCTPFHADSTPSNCRFQDHVLVPWGIHTVSSK